MTRKTVTKMMVDLLMTILLLLLMGYHYWGDDLHEWFGAPYSLYSSSIMF